MVLHGEPIQVKSKIKLISFHKFIPSCTLFSYNLSSSDGSFQLRFCLISLVGHNMTFAMKALL